MKFLFFIIILLIAIFAFLTYRTQTSTNQAIFLSGKIPSENPDGLYKGSAIFTASWLGKKFDASKSAGVNIFQNPDGTQIERYPFKTYVASGIRDTNLQVIKIDYDLPENPFWLRMILDEIVEVTPGKYIGKLSLRFIPGVSASLGYFFLDK